LKPILLIITALLLLQDQEPVVRSHVVLVTLNVRVTEKGDRDVHGLTQADFTLLENGHPQKIAVFGAEEQPVTLGILLDTSGSMRGEKIEHAKAALNKLLAAGHPDNQVLYQEFSDEVSPVVEITSTDRRLPQVLADVTAKTYVENSGTSFYDAVAIALCRLQKARYPRQALLVITDGADQNSRIHLDELVRLIRSSPAQVFFVGYFTGQEAQVFGTDAPTARLVSGHDIENPFVVFKRLAQESGTEGFFPRNEGDLHKAIEAVSGVLRAEYTLGYYPQRHGEAAPDPWRRIDVKVDRGGVHVNTRRGISTENANHLLFPEENCEISPKQRPYPFELKTEMRDELRIYHDDFHDAASGWPVNHGAYSERKYSREGYELSLAKSSVSRASERGTEGIVSAYGPWLRNFRATLKLTPPNVAASGLIFRLNDTGFYAFLVQVPKRGETLYKIVQHNFQTQTTVDLTAWASANLIETAVRGTDERTLTVECKWNSFKFFIDGQQVTTLQDSTIKHGLIGMALYGRDNVKFEDLLVEELH